MKLNQGKELKKLGDRRLYGPLFRYLTLIPSNYASSQLEKLHTKNKIMVVLVVLSTDRDQDTKNLRWWRFFLRSPWPAPSNGLKISLISSRLVAASIHMALTTAVQTGPLLKFTCNTDHSQLSGDLVIVDIVNIAPYRLNEVLCIFYLSLHYTQKLNLLILTKKKNSVARVMLECNLLLYQNNP